MATWTTVSSSDIGDIDGLMTGRKWTSSLNFNFPTTGSYYPSTYFTENGTAGYQFDINTVDGVTGNGTFVAASPAMISAYRHMLPNEFAAVTTGLNFTEVATDSQLADLSVGRAALVNDDQGKITGHGYFPGGAKRSGDTWYTTDSYYGGVPANGDFLVSGVSPGGPGWYVMLHEIGHSVGLKHAHEDGIVVPAAKDSYEYTVMTYRSFVGDDAARGFDGERYGRPQTLMQLDIQALQYMYGADFTTNATNTTYTFSPTTGQMFVNGAGQLAPGANRIFRTIWDGGGTDTYDLSNYTTNLTIDLNPGAWSTFSASQLAILDTATNRKAVGNVANALLFENNPASLIENATGGTGNDTIRGNAAANTLNGGAGSDILDGRSGADTMFGGTGNDTYYVDTYTDVAWEVAGGGTFDQVLASATHALTAGSQIERLATTSQTGTANIILVGNSHGQQILGNNGNNVLHGGGGVDTFVGYLGNDIYAIDNASETITEVAGQGVVDAVYSSVSYTLAAGLSIERFFTNLVAGTTPINLTGNEVGQVMGGNNGANVLYGGGGNDSIYGLGGNDTIEGAQGNDALFGGAGVDRFYFRESLGTASGIDRIYDMSSADNIVIDFISHTGALTPLTANQFRLGTAALDADDRVIYDAASRVFWADPDGNGAQAAILFGVLDGVPGAPGFVTHDMFEII